MRDVQPTVTPLTIHFLGGCSLGPQGAPQVAIRASRIQSLLALILLSLETPLSRQEVARLLWPEKPAEQARTNLRVLLSRLRQLHPQLEQAIHTDQPTLCWPTNIPYWLDIFWLEALTRRLRPQVSLPPLASQGQVSSHLTASHPLTPGLLEIGLERCDLPFLPDCSLPWLDPIRQTVVAWQTQLAEAILLAQVVHLEAPLRLRAAMCVLRRPQPSPPAALEALQCLVRVGATPQAQRLWSSLEARYAAAGTSPSVRAELAQKVNTALTQTRSPPRDRPARVNRQLEWQQLQRLWQEAKAGAARAVVLSGSPGLGKSYLLEALAEEVCLTGGRVCMVRAQVPEVASPFQAIVSLLRQLPAERYAPSGRRELSRLLPELHICHPGLKPAPPLTEAWQRRQLFESVCQSLIDDQPMLLAVDDLHACDQESLELLHYLVRTHPRAPLLLVGTVRPDRLDPDAPARSMFASLAREGLATLIPLAPLTADHLAELLAQIGFGPNTMESINNLHRLTEGNPLYLLELARGGGLAAGQDACHHPALERLYARRLEGLEARPAQLAALLACAGEGLSEDLLMKASGLELEELLDALDSLQSRQVLVEEAPGHWAFGHEQLAERASSQLAPAERRKHHQALGEALENLSERTLASLASRLGRHFEEAGLPARAIPYLLLAADQAGRVYARERQARLLTQAQKLLSGLADLHLEAQVEEAYSHYLEVTGAYGPLQESLQHLSQLSEARGDHLTRLLALARLARCLTVLGKLDAAIALCGQVLQEAVGIKALEAAALAAYTRSHARLRRLGAPDVVLQDGMEALDWARLAGAGALEYLIGGYLAAVLASLGRDEEAEKALEQALSAARQAEDWGAMARILEQAAFADARRRQIRRAEGRLRQALELDRQVGNELGEVHRMQALANCVYIQRRFGEALELYNQAWSRRKSLGIQLGEVVCQAGMGQALLFLGRLDEARAKLLEALEQARTFGLTAVILAITERLSLLEVSRGQPQAGLDLFAQLPLELQAGDDSMHLFRWLGEARALAALACWDGVGERLEKLRHQSGDNLFIQPYELEEEVLPLQAGYLAAQGRLEEALEVLSPLVTAMAERVEGYVQPQRAYHLWSQLLHRCGRQSEAEAALKRAQVWVEEVAASLAEGERETFRRHASRTCPDLTRVTSS